jgi:hypothetical protein
VNTAYDCMHRPTHTHTHTEPYNDAGFVVSEINYFSAPPSRRLSETLGCKTLSLTYVAM